jgi:hypothetical protein
MVTSNSYRGFSIAIISIAFALGIILYPIVAVVIAVLLVLAPIFLSSKDAILRVFFYVIGIGLLGYSFFGKGFAYCGLPPFFIGEALLGFGIIIFIAAGEIPSIGRSFLFWMVVLLIIIGSWGTINHISEYGILALRDAVIWGYAVFAVFVAAIVLRVKMIYQIVACYRRFLPWFLIWTPFAMLLYFLAYEKIPCWPVSQVPILNPKGGDIAVHLAGIMAFLVLGLHRKVLKEATVISSLKEWSWWGLWFAGCLIIFTGRAAILTVLCVSILLFLVHPLRRWYKVVFLSVLVVVISFVFNFEQSLVSHRAISPEGVMRTFKSIFFETGLDFYDGSRYWRLEWWREILDYTVFGDYFWTGKGYGVNLADDDGFQVSTEGLLRSPHNSHLTFLARSGVPGFAAWLLLQGTFSMGLWSKYRRARSLGYDNWAVLNLWILCYWLAFMINGSFDVFLEGPQGGIWFWCVFGFGIGVLEVQRRGEWSALYPDVRGAA